MSAAKFAVYIVGAKRTPFGTYGGKLKHISATNLAVLSSVSAIKQAGVSPDAIEEVFMGNVMQSSLDAGYLSRHVSLKSGVPMKSPALTINRLCGSGFESVCLGTEAILSGKNNINLCGGTENMSQSPMVIDGLSARWGVALGKGLVAHDSLWAGLTDSYANLPMAMTAENLAVKYKISRELCDEYAVRSQNAFQNAEEQNIFENEIVSVEVQGKKGPEFITVDEHPRKNVKIDDLLRLKAIFKKDGVVTAGNASGINDGAGSVVLASESAVSEHGLKPLARMVAWHRVGCDPSIMGIGPVEAIRGALKAANLTMQDMDIIEINEAFAAQYLACELELGIDRSKANVNGGAIAVGHPLGASGTRIICHLTNELIRRRLRYAIGSACIGGGQGIAVILENASL